MKVKFNKFERVAGLFVLTAIVGSAAATIGVAIQKGWFSSKIEYNTILESAEGIHLGTVVQVAGIRAGSVKDVELLSAREVRVSFEIFQKFQGRVREDSELQVIRPFVIGEKVFDISVGSDEKSILRAGSQIHSRPAFDLMDLFSGRKLAPFLGVIEDLAGNLQLLVKAFADEKRTQAFIEMFDRLSPLIHNLNRMSSRIIYVSDTVSKRDRLANMVDNVNRLAGELNVIVPQITEDSPHIGKEITQLVSNLSSLTDEFKKLTPTINAIAPELPRASQRAIEALDETVITLKAIQKSFLLRGNVEDVKEEEAKKRMPASE